MDSIGSRRVLKIGRKKTFRDVVRELHKKELHTMALSLSGATAGSKTYLGCYQHALKDVIRSLSDEDKLRYRARARNWSEHKLPPSQQSRYVSPIIRTGGD
jgi:hypothetical protein